MKITSTLFLTLFWLCLALAGPPTSAAPPSPATRSQLSLDGVWQTVQTPTAGDAPPTVGWKSVAAPATTYLTPTEATHFVWYRRDIVVPADWAGRRIFLDFHGARYDPHLYVDGRLVAKQFNGFAPFKTEITRWAQPGKAVQIALRCQDMTALYDGGHVPKPDENGRGKILAPAGGYRNFVGLWDDVTLSSTPQDSLDEDSLVAVPSTRTHTLTVQGSVDRPASGLQVGGRVLDRGKPVLTLPQVRVAADGGWAIRVSFPKAHFWSPEDPHLYNLELTLSHGAQGAAMDILPQRFGFKEIWTQGPDFYLNGVKRHLLASATWPLGNPEPTAAIRAKVRAIRASNTIAFRLHNQIWPEAWLDAADKAGLLIVDEAPLYTDGDGSYAYTDPRFWANYRDQIRGMIRRDRNHASLALWSLENETLFMSNQQYAKDLPQRLGGVGRFAKTLDPYHPITFEADQDPDGAADVIGLHYPHEMPWVYDYPNTSDWLETHAVTQAAGGMLGKRSTEFFWERKKPLYIGEYLWVPQQDYSIGSIYYGDDAYRSRDEYYNRAKRRAFYDQTLGYRRAGVSGVSPWTVFGFGGVKEDPVAVANEKEFYTPVAAFPQERGFRRFGGDKVRLGFDVFADDGRPHRLSLRLMRAGSAAPIAEQSLNLLPGGYRPMTLKFPTPKVMRLAVWSLRSVLWADGKPVHERAMQLRLYPRFPLHIPVGTRLIVYDPAVHWPESVPTLASLAAADTAHTVLLVAPGAFGTTALQGVPTISGREAGADQLQAFLRRGGRAVVLDQETLRPLGLDLELVAHNSTMTFPLRSQHPLLAGLRPDDLSYWGVDNYVTKMEVRRPNRYGARAVTVSGGPDSLGQSPIVEAPVGLGWVVVMQALVGEKSATEPAAARLLQNVVDYLAARPPSSANPALVVGADTNFTQKLAALGLDTRPSATAHSLILHGGGQEIESMRPEIEAVLLAGGTVYWHAPDPAAFTRLRSILGADSLDMMVSERGTSLRDRENLLLSGISREDLTYTTVPTGWDRQMAADVHASSRQFLPNTAPRVPEMLLTPEALSQNAQAFVVLAAQPGLYRLTLTADGTAENGEYPLLRIDANGVQTSWIPLTSADTKEYSTLVELPAGRSRIVISVTNGSNARQFHCVQVKLSQADYPAGMEVLALPGALVTWRQGNGRVVLDGTEWDTNTQNAVRGSRYASALFSGLGFAFDPPTNAPTPQPIPLAAFSLRGESAYFGQSADEITLRNNGLVEAKVQFDAAGSYHFRISGYSTPFAGVYGLARVTVDGKEVGTVEIKSPTAQWFEAGDLSVAAGLHTIGVAFTNDASSKTEDRNLFVRGVSVTAQ